MERGGDAVPTYSWVLWLGCWRKEPVSSSDWGNSHLSLPPLKIISCPPTYKILPVGDQGQNTVMYSPWRCSALREIPRRSNLGTLYWCPLLEYLVKLLGHSAAARKAHAPLLATKAVSVFYPVSVCCVCYLIHKRLQKPKY